MVLQTLIKNKACARTRTRARRWCLPRARGWTALPAPSPAGQLLAPTREPASRAGSPPVARPLRIDPRLTFSAGSTPPRARSFRAASETLSSWNRFSSQALLSPQRPTQGSRPHALPYLLSEEPARPAGRLRTAKRPSLPSPAPRRAGASSASAPGGAYHSDLMPEGEAEGAGAVPFAARGTGLHQVEPREESRLRTHLSLWEWERDGKHWASPVQVGVKGRTQRNTFCFGCSNSF